MCSTANETKENNSKREQFKKKRIKNKEKIRKMEEEQ
jgi:hypothetical protein